MTRRNRPERRRQPGWRGRSLVGERFTVDVGPVAHGGHFVARYEGRVVFVRHTLPGERVVVRVTEGSERDSFLRADAIEILRASPDRVEAPCRYAGPDSCGGCDFQHVGVPAQREFKAEVLRKQLRRLAGLEVPVTVERVPGDIEGLRWRTRMQWATVPEGGAGDRRGLRKYRSHEVVPVDDCLIDAGLDRTGVVTEKVRGRSFAVDADGFWQVHPGAPEVLVAAVLDVLRPRPGERALDLYAGVGLFSAFLAEAVGPAGNVVAVEGNRAAVEHARANLAAFGWATARSGRVDEAVSSLGPADIVVLDPPREGAKRKAVEGIARLGPRAVAYVACDPAALARDVAIFAESGYRLDGLRAFDLFPMTHHVEAVAKLVKSP